MKGPDATTPLTYSGSFWYTWAADIDLPSHCPGSCPSHPPLSVINLPGLCLPLESRPICEVQSRYHLPVHSIRPTWSVIHMHGSIHHADLFFRCSRDLAQANRGIWSALLFWRQCRYCRRRGLEKSKTSWSPGILQGNVRPPPGGDA